MNMLFGSLFPKLLVLYCFVPSTITQFYVYNTDVNDRNDWQHHCLFYYVLDNIVEVEQPIPLQHQMIPYCERPVERLIHRSASSYTGADVSIDFETLKKQQVTSEELFSWSAPVDLIERYQMYLENVVGLLNDECKVISVLASKDNYT